MTTVEVNPNRLLHLLALYGMTKGELLERLNKDRKIPFRDSDVFGNLIEESLIRKIDDIFRKGVAYYIDPHDLTSSPNESIFFRKQAFNADLNFGAKRVINQFENEKLELNALAKLADISFPRRLPTVEIESRPVEIADQIRQTIGPILAKNNRDFLKFAIDRLAEFNIIVFEFVEQWNLKEKANIDGCFIKPNVILLKRNQKAFKREIFTLFHELGHFLLNEEEIDDISFDAKNLSKLSSIEKWCSSFAFFYLLSDYRDAYYSIPAPNRGNEFSKFDVEMIASKTYLSSLAVYTRLRIDNRISQSDYETVRKDILKSIQDRESEEKRLAKLERERIIASGAKPMGSTPKPIISPLYLRTLKNALLEGLINEVRFCKKLRIRPEKLEEYLG